MLFSPLPSAGGQAPVIQHSQQPPPPAHLPVYVFFDVAGALPDVEALQQRCEKQRRARYRGSCSAVALCVNGCLSLNLSPSLLGGRLRDPPGLLAGTSIPPSQHQLERAREHLCWVGWCWEQGKHQKEPSTAPTVTMFSLDELLEVLLGLLLHYGFTSPDICR